MKTTDLEGEKLDYWVGRALGLADLGREYMVCDTKFDCGDGGDAFRPSTSWAHGGPIIERERIGVEWFGDPTGDMELGWVAASEDSRVFRDGTSTSDPWSCGPTALIVAMRCFVASKFGAEVPDEEAVTA